jgi:hypothetical protein
MKKLLFVVFIAIFLSCKKDPSKNITAYNWVLTSATISPTKMYKGKSETNYMLMDPSTCLSNNFTIAFAAEGTYGYASSGPLCDIIADNKSMKWTQNADEVSLLHAGETITAKIVAKNTLTYSIRFIEDQISYTVVYKYTAKLK